MSDARQSGLGQPAVTRSGRAEGTSNAWIADGLTPQRIAEPDTTESMALELRTALDRGEAVIPWGGGTHMSLGNMPSRYDVALSTAKLSRLVEHEPADLTISVEAGMKIGSLQSLLAEHGQFLPVDAPVGSTVGGTLATALAGPSSHLYGLPRDWLIGCRLALPDGTLVKGGGRVVKNVAGYDLPRVVAGSLGTLGVIVGATFKVAPRPAMQQTLLARLQTRQEAAGAILEATERRLALRAIALRDRQVAFWLAGRASAVERSQRELTEICAGGQLERLSNDEGDDWWSTPVETPEATSAPVSLRLSLQPTQVPSMLDRLVAELGTEPLAYPTLGVVLVSAPADLALIRRVGNLVKSTGGWALALAAPVSIKQEIDVWIGGNELSVMRRLKDEFDPEGTLNPGRFIGRI